MTATEYQIRATYSVDEEVDGELKMTMPKYRPQNFEADHRYESNGE